LTFGYGYYWFAGGLRCFSSTTIDELPSLFMDVTCLEIPRTIDSDQDALLSGKAEVETAKALVSKENKDSRGPSPPTR